MQIILEEASIHHLNKLCQIEKECFNKEVFTKQQIAYLLNNHNSVGIIAKINKEIAGFIIGKIEIDGKTLVGHILTIDVSLLHRRKGVAQRLLREIEMLLKKKGVKTCKLEVREDNIVALKLYEKLGYKKLVKIENYYSGNHGVLLRKTLK